MTMPSRLVIANFNTGLETDRKPFLIKNDSFPVLNNAFLYRGRVRKKPGNELIGRLKRDLSSFAAPDLTLVGPVDVITVRTFLGLGATEANATWVIPTMAMPFSFMIGAQTLTATDATGSMIVAGAGTITAASLDFGAGTITITSAGGGPLVTVFTGSYYPRVPSMGIEEYVTAAQNSTVEVNFPDTIFFDRVYAYDFNYSTRLFFDVSFYTSTHAPVIWHGANYQQFWSFSYQDAMFVTNNVPGMHFCLITAIADQSANVINITLNRSDLEIGDFVFFNEIQAATVNFNGKTAIVTDDTAAPVYEFTFTSGFTATITTYASGGICQYQTRSRTDQSIDGIRYYTGFSSSVPFNMGFVNFAPPLDNLSNTETTYLVGARMILAFGDRLLFFGTFEETSGGDRKYFGNRIRFSQISDNIFYSLEPENTAANPVFGASGESFFSNIPGFGGFVDIDSSDRIMTSGITQGVLILGMDSHQRRITTTGIEDQPFTIELLNPDYGSESTFSPIATDKAIYTVGDYGFITTTSNNAERFDTIIPQEVFQIDNSSFGNERVCSARDFIHEIMYFTYPPVSNSPNQTFPSQTLIYNYRDDSFGVFQESYTTYGAFREQTGTPWEELTEIPWELWEEPWGSGTTGAHAPDVAGGNQQGYIMKKFGSSSGNEESLYVQAVSGFAITSPDHNLSGGYIAFRNIDPAVTSLTLSDVYQIDYIIDEDNFLLSNIGPNNTTLPAPDTVITAGVWDIIILDNFFIKTKDFPMGWQSAAQTRIGAQKYLLDATQSGEFTVNIFTSLSSLSQTDPDNPDNRALIGSNVIRTYPDNALGLNDLASTQSQIWHRSSNGAVGTTVQLNFTMSQNQMLDYTTAQSDWQLHACVLDLYPNSRVLV